MSYRSGHTEWKRVVVNLVGDAVHARLAESRLIERRFLYGGEDMLYQFAFAAARLGYDVELRGWIGRAQFERHAQQVGASPRIGLEARRPLPDDLVIVPEGWTDPLEYARLILSPARLALMVLAAPGLFGWPFVAEEWERPDPLTVPIDTLARPEHFQAMAALGFRLLIGSPRMVDVVERAGVDWHLVGEGHAGWERRPDAEKSVDALAIGHNRWAPLADRVLRELGDLKVDRVGEVSNDEVLARMARARVLVWPSRIEGHARIPWEARSVGCVPVALNTNPFAVGLDEEHGAVAVDTVEQIAPAIRALLEDHSRWKRLSRLGRATAPAEVDWNSFLDRVRRFLNEPWPTDPSTPALAGIGEALDASLRSQEAEAKRRLEELGVAGKDLEAAAENQERLILENQYLSGELSGLYARRSVRAVLLAARLLRR
jgi:hypothetical protein